MERLEYINQIKTLQADNRHLLDLIETLKLTLDSVSASNRRNEELVKRLTAQIEELRRMVKNLEDRNRRHNKNTFGQKTHKASKHSIDWNPNMQLFVSPHAPLMIVGNPWRVAEMSEIETKKHGQ